MPVYSMDKSTESPLKQLEEWFQKEKETGLFDIKLFVSPDPDVSSSERAADVLKMITAWKEGRFIRITSEADLMIKTA